MKSLPTNLPNPGGLAAPLLRWQLPWSCPVGCEENVANSFRAALGTAAGHRHLTKLGGFQRGVDGWDVWDDVFKGWIGVSPFNESFLVEQKEWEKRQKVDKNLELGGFLGGRSDFLLMFFVDIFTTDVAETFFLLDENSPKKRELTSETRGEKPRRHEKFWE